MALTGFDPSVVNSSISSVKSAYEEMMTVFDSMQTQFVGGMEDKWACVDAQTFFEGFADVMNRLISDVNVTFESVVMSMNSAAQAFATQMGASYNAQSFSAITKTIDISGIKENINGVRGIDLQLANEVAAKLPGLAGSAEQALAHAQGAVQNCGFIGGDMSTNLNSSLTTIKEKFNSYIGNITSQSKTAIENTVQKYADTQGKIAQAFAGGN